MKVVYHNLTLSNFQVQSREGAVFLTSKLFPGKEIATSERFFRSLWTLCQIDEKLFRYFSSEEIFARVVERQGEHTHYRFCFEIDGSKCRLLAVSKTSKAFVSLETLLGVISLEKPLDSGYHEGVVFSVSPLFDSVPARGQAKIAKSAEEDVLASLYADGPVRPLILRRFPIDGLGKGRLAFGVSLGDKYLFFDTPKMNFQTEEAGLHRDHFILRQPNKTKAADGVEMVGGKRTFSIMQAAALRLKSAARSALSLGEIASFYRLCDRFSVPLEHYDEILSHPFEAYGLASYNAFSSTRMSRLPTKHTVLDLFEVMALAVQEFPVLGRWKLFELAGRLLATYYDFEETLFEQVTSEAAPALAASVASLDYESAKTEQSHHQQGEAARDEAFQQNEALIKELFRKNRKMSPRSYQVDTIAETLRLFTENNYHSLLIESPTGSGKTVMGIISSALLAKKIGARRIGWVAMRQNLLTQAMDVAKSFGLEHLFEPISMFSKNPPPVDILVVDEAHHDATMSMATLHKKIKPKKVLGLSATPQRADRAELIFEKVISKAGIYELVRLGYLAHADQLVLPDWNVDTVCSTFLAEPKRWGKSIIFFHTMEECELALERLRLGGISSEIVHSGSPNREAILFDFESGRLTALINMAILTEGFDSPDLETVFVRPSNRMLTQQMAGRVLRPAPVAGMRKKVVQSQDSPAPFSSLAPIGRSFKRKPDGQWLALDYDSELISRLISDSNKKLSEHMSMISQATHQVLRFLNAGKEAAAVARPAIAVGRPFLFDPQTQEWKR